MRMSIGSPLRQWKVKDEIAHIGSSMITGILRVKRSTMAINRAKQYAIPHRIYRSCLQTKALLLVALGTEIEI